MATTRVTIDRAIGVLMWRHDLDASQAFHWLVDVSQADGSMVVDAARDVLEQVRPHTS